MTDTQTQMIQMASRENLGRMIVLANAERDREFNRRLELQVEHALCQERIRDLETDLSETKANLALVNQRLAVANAKGAA